MKQRRLHPVSTDNQNSSCPDFCVDSTCPYGCYPYPDMYPFPQPLPPLPESAPPSLSKQSQHLSAYIIVIISLLASCFLLISYYVILVKYCSGWNPFRPRRRQPQADAEEEFLDENRGPEIVHPIWYINTVGLQPSIINSITIFRYTRGDTLIDGTDCSVCLNEFQNGETLRLLPKCNHAFHIPCIDTWLRSHTNCPVCRAGIISNALAAPLASNGLNSNIISQGEGSQLQSSTEINGEINHGNRERDDALHANGADLENAIEIVDVSQAVENAKMNLDSKGNEASLARGDFKDKSLAEDEHQEMQKLRRSLSVDFLVAANISEAAHSLCIAESKEIIRDPRLDLQHDSAKHASGNSRLRRTVSGSSITQSLHKKPVRMKRSFSYSGRSFASRQYARSNSILPL